jgi:hypothetical protein
MSNDLPLPAALAPITNAPALMHALGSPLRWDVMRKLALDGPHSAG